MSCPSRWRRIVWQSESPVTSFSGSAIMLALLYLLAGLKEADLTRSRFSLHFLWLAQVIGMLPYPTCARPFTSPVPFQPLVTDLSCRRAVLGGQLLGKASVTEMVWGAFFFQYCCTMRSCWVG
jgi:hypothetical protein